MLSAEEHEEINITTQHLMLSAETQEEISITTQHILKSSSENPGL